MGARVHMPSGKESWVYWGEGVTGRPAQIWVSDMFARVFGRRLFISVSYGTFLAFISGLLVFSFAPSAAGSGIPEVKTILQLGSFQEVTGVQT